MALIGLKHFTAAVHRGALELEKLIPHGHPAKSMAQAHVEQAAAAHDAVSNAETAATVSTSTASGEQFSTHVNN